MGNARIERLEKSFHQQEYDSKPLNIVLGSLNYTNDSMVICTDDGFSGTVTEGKQFMEDHPENDSNILIPTCLHYLLASGDLYFDASEIIIRLLLTIWLGILAVAHFHGCTYLYTSLQFYTTNNLHVL